MTKRFEYHDWKQAYEPDFGTRKKEKTNLTKRQRNWIIKMWDTIYNAPEGKHACVHTKDGNLVITFREKVQVHHIMPQRFGQQRLGMNRTNLSEPQNLIPLSEDFHVGRGYRGELDHHNNLVPIIHPDIV